MQTPERLARMCAFLQYSPEEITTALVEMFDITEEEASRITDTAVEEDRQEQERIERKIRSYEAAVAAEHSN